VTPEHPNPNLDASRAESFAAVGLASSAGGVVALQRLFGALPSDLPIAVLIVQHVDRRHGTLLADILARRTSLKVTIAEDGELTQPGRVYIAKPDHHLLVERGGRVRLTQTELVHFVRPSADLLFESMAATWGPKAIGCVLTGSVEDGAMGVRAIKERGGTVIVQDPTEAQFSGMPQAAVRTGCADFVLPLDEIATAISVLATEGRGGLS